MKWESLFEYYLTMFPKFLLPIAIGLCIQVIKVIIDLIKSKSLHLNSLRSSGGFPSVHSGIAASITTMMWHEHGINSTAFALAFCFSFLFCYDAVTIRYEAGKHAKFLKKIGEELEGILDIGAKTTFLKERLGHTFFEVMGGICIGVVLTLLFYGSREGVHVYLFGN